MSLLGRLAPLAALLVLAGCFISREPLIAANVAVLPVDGEITVCLDANDPCITLKPEADGYLASPPDEPEEDVMVRFAPLIQSAGRQVFIAEAALETEEGTAFIYGLARRLPAPDTRGATMQIAALDCAELSDEQRAQFEAEGGLVEGSKTTECQPVTLDQLKQVLLAAHQAGLATDAWWQAHAEEF
ncbi:MAG: hypothetical protein VX593_05290 [Pseudomonadota bacterium]|nr:hypothetical protein [Pseudomonadota bacterium]